MDHELQLQVLTAFDQSKGLYADIANTASALLETLLRQESIPLHSITHRCKQRDSLERKLARPDKSYKRLEDITDLAGVRLTTYFADDVDRVAQLIERELSVDTTASVDKRKSLDPDRFGYQSLHYIVQFSDARRQLAEYRRFGYLKFEIQIRSILQHAWAEIEHDLGYKSAIGVPSEVRRRFARVAGLLELADLEFASIRTALRSYEVDLPGRIAQAPDDVQLDIPSLRVLYESSSAVAALDQIVVTTGSGRLGTADRGRWEKLIERLRTFGITTIGQLENTAKHEADTVFQFVKYWIDSSLGAVDPGIGIFYLLYVLAWRTADQQKVFSYLDDNSIGEDLDRTVLASRILAFKPENRQDSPLFPRQALLPSP